MFYNFYSNSISKTKTTQKIYTKFFNLFLMKVLIAKITLAD